MDVMEKLRKSKNFDKYKWIYFTHGKTTKNYKFENRMKNYEKVLFILAGYKQFTYDILFKRVKEFIPDDIEVCILSSGKYCEDLSKIAEENDWSYLSTKRNCVSLIQNTAINIFKNAKYIYKIDEDIFITKNFFDNLFKTLIECKKNSDYNPGFVAPTIPINGFSNMLVLQRYNLIDKYTKKFEKPKYAAGSERMIENNPEVAKFMWGEGKYLPNIDQMDYDLNKDKFDYVACPIRFSIGAILFERSLWEDMYMFDVKHGSCMGLDESCICSYCMISSKTIIVSKNTLVGHLSFGTQNKTMKEYFEKHKDVFDIHKIKGEE